jgi:hypothetical protein
MRAAARADDEHRAWAAGAAAWLRPLLVLGGGLAAGGALAGSARGGGAGVDIFLIPGVYQSI